MFSCFISVFLKKKIQVPPCFIKGTALYSQTLIYHSACIDNHLSRREQKIHLLQKHTNAEESKKGNQYKKVSFLMPPSLCEDAVNCLGNQVLPRSETLAFLIQIN